MNCDDTVKMTNYEADLSVDMECDDDDYELRNTASSPVFPTEASEMLQSYDLDTQLADDGENDGNGNTLCHACGCVGGCQCFHPQTDDHNYAASVRPTVRTHKRTGVKLTRKRTRNYSKWKSVQRKHLRQQGKVYVMSSGATAKAKVVKACTRDHEACRFKCAVAFDDITRQIINDQHWSITDDEKRQFYLNTTSKSKKARTRRADDCNKKKMSFMHTTSIIQMSALELEYARSFTLKLCILTPNE